MCVNVDVMYSEILYGRISDIAGESDMRNLRLKFGLDDNKLEDCILYAPGEEIETQYEQSNTDNENINENNFQSSYQKSEKNDSVKNISTIKLNDCKFSMLTYI